MRSRPRLCCVFVLIPDSCTWHLSLLCLASRFYAVCRSEDMRITQRGEGDGKGGLGCDPGGETLHPPATLAPLSASCLSASLHRQSCLVMPAVNGHTHTQHTHPQLPQIFFTDVKVSDSIRGSPVEDDHMAAAKQESQSHFSLIISSWQIRESP